MAVYIAKQEIADPVIKIGMLTDSLTDKVLRNPKIAGMQVADELVPTFDQFIKEGVNLGASCEVIEQSQRRGQNRHLLRGMEREIRSYQPPPNAS